MTWPLAQALEHAIRTIWPRRTEQELLLDLGERKSWTEDGFVAAVEAAADWMRDELLLPDRLEPLPAGGTNDLEEVRALGGRLPDVAVTPGVARWVSALAPALGASEKTLANSVGKGLRADRADHRWLRLVVRVARGEAAPAAWAYHRRSPVSVAAELRRTCGRVDLDAGDALLVLSLLALWQRRRPTAEARANRGRTQPRRSTPKPVASLRGRIMGGGQLRQLDRVANELDAAAAHALRGVAIEAALTEAHLAPHPVRHGDGTGPSDGEDLLQAVERLLPNIVPEERDVLTFRIARMRAWRDRDAVPAPSASAVRDPYVQASLALEAARRGDRASTTFDPSTPGLLMLLPLLRARRLQVTS